MASPLKAEPLTVFAAASLKNAFDAIGEAFTRETGTQIVFSYAGTSALARQIEQGAPADVFVSANREWVAYLSARGVIDPTSSTVFASNSLVLIAPASTHFDALPDLSSADDLLAVLGEGGRLAVALVDAVPAGIYARQAMENLGVWEALEPHLAQSDNVRSALFLVARGEAPLGIVYASDAMAEANVHVVGRFPDSSHAPVSYSASRNPDIGMRDADVFLTYLMNAEAQLILARHGFLPPVHDD
jgi:molybdate transport system substrate-binding protein